MRRQSAFGVALLLANALCAQTLQQAEALWKARDYKGANEVFKKLEKADINILSSDYWDAVAGKWIRKS